MSTESMVTQAALGPCPFCGARPHQGLTKVEHCQLHGEPFQRFEIWCPHGCAKINRVNRDCAITAWNTRHQPQEREAVGYVSSEHLSRRGEYERNGTVMYHAPSGTCTTPVYSAALTTPAPAVSTLCENRHCGDNTRCFECDGCRAFMEEPAPAVSTDEIVTAQFASAAEKLEVPEGHPDKPQRDFAIGVLWALQEAIHTRALLAKHSPDAPGDERHG